LPVDVRPQFVTVPGQDVLSADGVTLEISLAELQVADPHVAVNKNASFQNSLYLTLQMAVRETVGKEKINTLIENCGGFGAKRTELTSGKATEYGLADFRRHQRHYVSRRNEEGFRPGCGDSKRGLLPRRARNSKKRIEVPGPLGFRTCRLWTAVANCPSGIHMIVFGWVGSFGPAHLRKEESGKL
jgi:hypothetical protein